MSTISAVSNGSNGSASPNSVASDIKDHIKCPTSTSTTTTTQNEYSSPIDTTCGVSSYIGDVVHSSTTPLNNNDMSVPHTDTTATTTTKKPHQRRSSINSKSPIVERHVPFRRSSSMIDSCNDANDILDNLDPLPLTSQGKQAPYIVGLILLL